MNDLINYIMHQAAKHFGGNDGIFNAAGFAQCFKKVAGLNSPLDGEEVRVILCGRPDVRFLKGGAHFQIIENIL